MIRSKYTNWQHWTLNIHILPATKVGTINNWKSRAPWIIDNEIIESPLHTAASPRHSSSRRVSTQIWNQQLLCEIYIANFSFHNNALFQYFIGWKHSKCSDHVSCDDKKRYYIDMFHCFTFRYINKLTFLLQDIFVKVQTFSLISVEIFCYWLTCINTSSQVKCLD